MAIDENGFLEYLQLQGGEPELVTKSELIHAVRSHGRSVSDRQLTFYVTEGLLPKSARVGTRAGAYPRIVTELLTWILDVRDAGLAIDVIKEMLPVWKYLVRSRRDHQLDLSELQYIARQHISSVEGSMNVPALVQDVMTAYCPDCRGEIKLILKDRTEIDLDESGTTMAFAIAQQVEDEDGQKSSRIFARTRIAIGNAISSLDDPTLVQLGLPPNEPFPSLPERRSHASHNSAEVTPI